MLLPESDLLFNFPADWVVRKYDATEAYQSLSGHGLKGVDFLALSPDGYLWLIEVKNFRPRYAAGLEYRAKRRSPEKLAAQVARKFSDTLRLIHIVDRALRKHWYRRLKLWYVERMAGDQHSNYWFWAEAKRRIDVPAKVVYVLWLETPEKKAAYGESTRALLAALLPPGASLFVAESERPNGLPFSAGPAGESSAQGQDLP